jgi:phosphoglycolate phosphatase
MKNGKNLLIFDYDGTIVDSGKCVLDAFNETAPKYNIKKLKSLKDLGKLYRRNVFESIHLLGVPRKELRRFFLDWRIPYLKNYKRIKAFSGMKNIVNNLAKNNVLIIVTSNSSDSIKKSMKKLGIKIREVVGGEKEMSKVVKITKLKKRYPKLEAYYIGDTGGDAKEAKRAGIKSIAVSWGYNSKRHLIKAKPDFIVDKPRDLLRIFQDE